MYRIRIRNILGHPEPDPLLFLTDPNPVPDPFLSFLKEKVEPSEKKTFNKKL